MRLLTRLARQLCGHCWAKRLISRSNLALSARMPNAANLGIVSSVATDHSGTVYALQRGDKADPVIAVDRDGKVLRSWGKGFFPVPSQHPHRSRRQHLDGICRELEDPEVFAGGPEAG